MNSLTPSITVKVDPTNPGQFFACCGLLELADRLWPGAEGWFAHEGKSFHVSCNGTLRNVLEYISNNPPTVISRLASNGLEVAPIIAPLAFSFDGGVTVGLILDTWTQIRLEKRVGKVVSNPPWNFWSGQQKSSTIWEGLRGALLYQMQWIDDSRFEKLFDQRLFLGGRFGFDCGPAWNALDVGFSPNEQGMEVESCPAIELLAAVGLQRFRPMLNRSRDRFDYFTWHNPYSPAVAAAAMTGFIVDYHSLRLRGTVVSRGQYAALGVAFSLKAEDTDE